MIALPRRLSVAVLAIAGLTAFGVRETRAADISPEWPSFLLPGEVLCLDELDFNAYSRTGRFHTRGSQESCTVVTQLTRVAVLAQAGHKSQVRLVGGPLDAHVGWTNGRLPLAGPKPADQ